MRDRSIIVVLYKETVQKLTNIFHRNSMYVSLLNYRYCLNLLRTASELRRQSLRGYGLLTWAMMLIGLSLLLRLILQRILVLDLLHLGR